MFNGTSYGITDKLSLTKSQIDAGLKVQQLIKSVVVEEMLHLCLAANLLSSLGFVPDLYNKKTLPKYPSNFPYHTTLLLYLDILNEDSAKLFQQIEIPSPPTEVPAVRGFSSIGQFYKCVKQALNAKIKFGHETFQLPPGLGYAPHSPDSGDIVIVKDFASANKAIDIIVTQGEGIPSDGIEPLQWADSAHFEKSHYKRFTILLELVKDPNLVVWPVKKNIKRDDLPTSKLRTAVDLFNACYCYLLLALENIWMTDNLEKKKKPCLYCTVLCNARSVKTIS